LRRSLKPSARTRRVTSSFNRAPTGSSTSISSSVQQSNENPVYYVQYAHARIASILRTAAERGVDAEGADTALLNRQGRARSRGARTTVPELVDDIRQHYGVHQLTTYALELAARSTVFIAITVSSTRPTSRDRKRAYGWCRRCRSRFVRRSTAWSQCPRQDVTARFCRGSAVARRGLDSKFQPVLLRQRSYGALVGLALGRAPPPPSPAVPVCDPKSCPRMS